jgi:gliding motility-associated-like protein
VYTVVPVSAAGCEGEPFTVTVIVNPEPIVANQSLTICSDVALGLTLGNDIDGPSATRYNITNINANGLTASAGTPIVANNILSNELFNDSWTNTTSAPVDVVYTIVPVSAVGCSGDAFTVTVTINPEPVVANQIVTMCSDLPLGLVLGNDSNGPNVVSYNITNINSNGLTASAGVPIVANGVNSNELIDDAWRNLGNTAINVIYTVVPVGQNGCLGNSFTVTATINPEPVVVNQTVTICSDAVLGVNFNSSSSVGATSYNVTNLQLNGLVVSAGAAAVANGLTANALFNDAFTNLTSLPVNVVYTVVPVSAAGCEGEPFTVTVIVNPRPKILDKQLETCSGESFSYLPINNAPTEIVPVGTTYSWSFVDNLSISGETNGINQLQFAQLNLTNNTNINQIVVFTVTATSGSCSSTFEIQLTVKPKPFVPNPSGLTDTRCSGDTFVIVPQNGIPTSATIVPAGTTYSWTFVDNPNVTGESNGFNQPTITQVLTNLTNVNQSVQYTVTPLSGTCQGLPFTVVFWVEPKPFIPNVIETVCDGGSFILTPVNGLVPTTNTIVPNITLYSWTASASVNVTGFTTGTNQPFFNSGILVNGGPTVQTVTYIVTPTYYVSSNPGIPRCIGDSFTITVSVNPGVEDNEVITNIACSYSPLCGGSIVLNPVGVGPFTYVWTYTGTGINAITNPTLQNQLNLCPGNYQVEITDSLNCTYTFNYVIQPPTPIVSSLVTLQNISCNNVNVPPCDGYIELAVSGGTPFATPNASGQVYTFEWYKETPLGSGNFTLITSGSPILMNACVGNYKLKVVDANGCIHWSVPYLIENQFTLINIVETISNYNGFEIACNGGNSGYVHNVISGGSGTYNYVFLNQTTGSIISQGVVNASIPTPPGSINLNFDNLVSGTYQLTITDPFCPNNIVRTYVLDAPTQLQSSFTLVSLPVQCYNGTATYNVTATGGVGPYSGTGNYTLAAGVHPIVVTDSNGCTSTQVITVTQPTELVPQVVLTSPILCFGGTAQVTVTASGGTGAYTGTGTFTVTAGGPYNYTVTDANGCTKQVSIIVTQPSQLSFVIDSTQNPTCSPDRSYSNGSICITISGGTNPTPVGAGWVNIGGNKWCLNNLSAGNYTINVTDLNSCASTGVQNVTLTRPTPLQAFINNNIQVNCATSTVTQNNYVFANGGTPPYTFTWSGGVACNPANPQCMTTTINGNYIAYVNDAEGIANGCPPIEVPFVVNLIEIGTPSFTFSSYASINCGSLAIKDPILFTNTSTGDYASLSWFVNGVLVSNQETFTHEFDEVGDYTVTLTVNYTIAGITCTYSETEVLSITNGYDIVIPNAFTPNGDGINDTIRPVYKCMDKMEMSVYDTWGSLLYFEEDTDLKGWDGTINGKEAENGNYIIVVRATTFAGKDLFINGPVTLIK